MKDFKDSKALSKLESENVQELPPVSSIFNVFENDKILELEQE